MTMHVNSMVSHKIPSKRVGTVYSSVAYSFTDSSSSDSFVYYPKQWITMKSRDPIEETYKTKVSLNLGDQILFFDLVENRCFLSANNGPTRTTSTNGRNVPVVAHFRLFAAITIVYKGKPRRMEYQRRVLTGCLSRALCN